MKAWLLAPTFLLLVACGRPESVIGESGAPGTPGADGQNGEIGATGEQGTPGTDGVDGQSGVQGPTGAPGQSCTVAQYETGALITCPDGTHALVLHGTGRPPHPGKGRGKG